MTSRLDLLHPRTAQRRVTAGIASRQEEVLKSLPVGVKVSLALDCWTSPFMDAFMAVTAYFLDQNWEYREVLLGFEPIFGSHTGMNLSVVVMDILQKYKLTDRVLAVTTDNASNNTTLLEKLQDCIELLELDDDATVVHIPCLAHVIQLSLKSLLGEMKAAPDNDTTEKAWEQGSTTRPRGRKGDIVDTLEKVWILKYDSKLYANISFRSESLLFM